MTQNAFTEDYQAMIQDCENRESRMTDWEVGFIASIAERIDGDKPLSANQVDKLNQVWGRITEGG